ncbi:uncharacterized protein LOC133891797 [Phragmites australis]|uniref:uncharacterized protein LOC133891797 n=1 Tax=Phragmites australis TaxID=29695 RepID=UPI002D78C08C|nr:uncharacterized protein LOC133891797 [Phragmites australis]
MTESEPEPQPFRRGPWPSSPLDDDDLLSEILRLLPPRASSLPRASLVCKRWRRLATSPHFLRDFRAFHRAAPPLLGVFHNSYLGNDHRFVAAVDPPDQVPDARFRMPCGRDHRSWRFLDCRHGRALLLGPSPRREVLVWDPMTGARHREPLPPDAGDVRVGAVLCCHARDCRSSPFNVVLVWWKQEAPQHRRAFAAVYSSESGAWSHVISAQMQVASTNPTAGDARKPGTLAGDAMYWLLPGSPILKFDTVRRSLAFISMPMCAAGFLYWQCQLVLTEGGVLGLAMATPASVLVWKMDAGPAAADGAGWSMHRSVPLDGCLPPRRGMQGVLSCLLGFHEESNVIFFWIDAGVFMIQLETMQSRMVCQGVSDFQIYPFAGFYTADAAGAQADDDAPEGTHVPRLAMESLTMWHYADPRGDVHGPFPMAHLRRWNNQGFFDEGLMVWRTDQTKQQAVLLTDAMRSTARARFGS